MKMRIENLCFSYAGGGGVQDLSLQVETGEFVGLIGPNGSGKSTALKNLYRALTPDSGRVELDGEDLLRLSPRAAAQRMAVVCQENQLPFDFTVEEIVAMGRSPHKRLLDVDTPEDRRIVRAALEAVNLASLARRSFLHLSGGEKQRVLLARAIAQQCDFLVLDEPTNHLDIGYQLQIFDWIRRLKVSVLAAVHDLNLAALYCDRLYVLQAGRLVASGTPGQVLTPELIRSVYGVESRVELDPRTGRPAIRFLPEGMAI